MADSRKRIKVLSLESNGCVFNDGYLYLSGNSRSVHKKKNTSPDRLSEANEKLFQHVADDLQRREIREVIMMAGSYRQDKASDLSTANEFQPDSFLSVFQRLSKIFAAKIDNVDFQIDGYLLADTYGNHAAGATFDACISGNESFAYTHCLVDESKLTLLYAQMHRIATQNPEADISFDVFDASAQRLLALNHFFAANKSLIPGNVTLNFNFYDGDKINAAGMQVGCGAIDFNYHYNLLKMLECAAIDLRNNMPESESDAMNVMNRLLPSGLSAFKKQRKLVGAIKSDLDEVEDEHDGVFDPGVFIGELLREINEISVVDHKTQPFNTALYDLYVKLGVDISDAASRGVNPVYISNSAACEIAKETVTFLRQLKSAETPDEKTDCVNKFVQHYEKQSRWKNFMKALAVVAITALAMIAGAVIGCGIGMAAGTATGLTTGAMVGMAAGCAVTGIAAGSISGFLLFKRDDKSKAFKELVTQAKCCLT